LSIAAAVVYEGDGAVVVQWYIHVESHCTISNFGTGAYVSVQWYIQEMAQWYIKEQWYMKI